MNVRYTTLYLNKLEEIFAESDFNLRYERGHFKSGFCILKDEKVVVVNKFYTIEGKINCLIEILRSLQLDVSKLKDKSKTLYQELNQTQIAF